jgi:hypothetical protein
MIEAWDSIASVDRPDRLSSRVKYKNIRRIASQNLGEEEGYQEKEPRWYEPFHKLSSDMILV